MKTVTRAVALAAAFLIPGGCMPAPNDTWRSADVLIYGATPAGLIAARTYIDQTPNSSRKVLIISEDDHLGGMTTSGLSATDRWTDGHIQGPVREFFVRVARQYNPSATQPIWYAEPHKYRAAFVQLITHPRIQWHENMRLSSVEKSGKHITAIRATDPAGTETRYTARQFIDATYGMDLGRAAGVPYRIGREPRGQHNESLAGYRPGKTFSVSPFDAPGVLSPFVQAWDGSSPGDGDDEVQSANFRLCVTDQAANRIAMPAPDAYDPARWALYERMAQALPPGGERSEGNGVGDTIVSPYYVLVRLQNGKFDMNGGTTFSLELPGGMRGWTEADGAGRAAIYDRHWQHTLEYFQWVMTSPSVPAYAKARLGSLGLCADEFQSTGGRPPRVYVRESARAAARAIISQNGVTSLYNHADSIAVAYYPFDAKLVRMIASADGQSVIHDGAMYSSAPRFEVPYRAITPEQAHADNLLLPVTPGCTHVVWGSLRMEPYLMALGVTAAVAAHLAITHKTTVQHISNSHIGTLRSILRDDLGQWIDRNGHR